MTGGVRDRDVAAVGPGQPAGDEESEPDALVEGVALDELVEDLVNVRGWHSAAVIADHQSCRVAMAAERDHDLRSDVAVLGGVRQEVEYDLANRGRVGVAPHRVAADQQHVSL